MTRARLVMLDGPASESNEAEADKLASVVRGMRTLRVSPLAPFDAPVECSVAEAANA